MIFQCHRDTDMFVIKLAERVSTESEEVAPGNVLDFDDQGRVVGVEIEDASNLADLSNLHLKALPIATVTFSERASLQS